jgi:hypothetical protein
VASDAIDAVIEKLKSRVGEKFAGGLTFDEAGMRRTLLAYRQQVRVEALGDAYDECSKVWQQLWECHRDPGHPEVRAAGRCEEAIAELIEAAEQQAAEAGAGGEETKS